MKASADNHFSENVMRRYLTARHELSEEEILEIEEHLGTCGGSCIDEVRRQHAAPRPSIGSWTAKAHGQAFRWMGESGYLSLPTIKQMVNWEGELRAKQWKHVLSCLLCAGALAHLRKAAAAIVVNFQGEDLLSPLPGFPVKDVPARAAPGGKPIEIAEPGLVDFVMPASVPPGTMVKASKKDITVVVPCADPFDQTPPRVELLLEEGEIRSTEPKQEQRNIRKIAGDPKSLQSRLCWVACFENVPTGAVILTVAPGQQLPRG